jgi:hypothetical protein
MTRLVLLKIDVGFEKHTKLINTHCGQKQYLVSGKAFGTLQWYKGVTTSFPIADNLFYRTDCRNIA